MFHQLGKQRLAYKATNFDNGLLSAVILYIKLLIICICRTQSSMIS